MTRPNAWEIPSCALALALYRKAQAEKAKGEK